MTGNLPAVIQMSLFSYALMAAIAMVTAGLIAALVAGLASVGRRHAAAAPVAVVAPPPPVVQAPAPSGRLDPTVVAVIAAAVRAMGGEHRIVWIGEAQPMGGWTSEVRQRHHSSHHPHHDH